VTYIQISKKLSSILITTTAGKAELTVNRCFESEVYCDLLGLQNAITIISSVSFWNTYLLAVNE
jgi:hypothetical protein